MQRSNAHATARDGMTGRDQVTGRGRILVHAPSAQLGLCWEWRDQETQIYLAAFSSESAALEYGRARGWIG